MDIGITATREGLTGPQLESIINRLDVMQKTQHDFLHQGCCIGGDEQITIAAFTLGYRICSHPPTDRRYYFSKLAYELSENKCTELSYLARNLEIINHSSVVIGAPKTKYEELRSGTWSTIRIAREAGRHTIVVYKDGGSDEYNV
jgi:hypothetical protein